jgi:hypothetical protein
MENAPASLWRKLNASYNLVGSRCERCGTVYFPPRIVCKNCGRESKLKEHKLSGDGTVYSFTKIHMPPDAFRDEAPYVIAVVKTVEGPLVEGHVVENGKEVAIGARVRTVLRRMFAEGEDGLIHYHYKFELV